MQLVHIVKDTVVGKGKLCTTGFAVKGMIVVILLGKTVGGVSGVSDDSRHLLGRLEGNGIRRLWCFVDYDSVLMMVGNSASICASYRRFACKLVEQCRQVGVCFFCIGRKSEDSAHLIFPRFLL